MSKVFIPSAQPHCDFSGVNNAQRGRSHVETRERRKLERRAARRMQTSTVDLFAGALNSSCSDMSFCQCISHLGIVVDDQNSMPVRHRSGPRRRSARGSSFRPQLCRAASREVEHARTKESKQSVALLSSLRLNLCGFETS